MKSLKKWVNIMLAHTGYEAYTLRMKKPLRYSQHMKLLNMRKRIDAAKSDQNIRILRRVIRSCDMTTEQQNRVYRWERNNVSSI
jgi:hypothetical protein